MKRTLLILAFVLLWSQSAFAANAFVQACTGTWTSGTTLSSGSCTFGAGHLVAVGIFVFSGNNAQQFSSMNGDGTNTYTQIDALTSTADSGLFVDALTYYAKNVAGGAATVTVTLNSTAITAAYISLIEYSGADTSSPLDVHANYNRQPNVGTGAGAITTSSVTTTTNGEAVIAFMFCARGGAINFTAGSGFATRATYGTADGIAEDQIQTSAGSITATATQDYSDAFTYNFSAIATFKAAGGGGGSTPHNLTLLGVGN